MSGDVSALFTGESGLDSAVMTGRSTEMATDAEATSRPEGVIASTPETIGLGFRGEADDDDDDEEEVDGARAG